METRGVRLALVSSQLEANFIQKFTNDRWALLYWDDVAAVIIKRMPVMEKWVNRLGYYHLRPFLSGSEIMSIVEQGQGDKLEEELRRHLALSPKSPRGNALLGWMLLAEGKPVEALRAFEESLELDAHISQAHWGAARTLEALGQKEAARLHWRELIRLRAEGAAGIEARQASKP
jgi:tetratricopeptide (TPR) repeat protein